METQNQNLLYFAYGEHMNEGEMNRDCPQARMVGVSSLKGYSLCFIGRDGSARAGLRLNPNGNIPGRVWALPQSQAEQLDKIADHPYFARREIRDVSIGGMTLPVMVYITAPGQPCGRPGFVTYDIMREAYESVGEDTDTLRTLAMSSAP